MLCDELQLFDGVDAEELCVDGHGIRGGWACGHIVTQHSYSVVMTDNYQRTLLVADRRAICVASSCPFKAITKHRMTVASNSMALSLEADAWPYSATRPIG